MLKKVVGIGCLVVVLGLIVYLIAAVILTGSCIKRTENLPLASDSPFQVTTSSRTYYARLCTIASPRGDFVPGPSSYTLQSDESTIIEGYWFLKSGKWTFTAKQLVLDAKTYGNITVQLRPEGK